MDYDNKSKNYFSQDSSLEDKTFKIKSFNLFYLISKEKQYNRWTIFIFIFLEMIQLISYAFDDPHKPLWKIKESTINNIVKALGATRIISLMEFINFIIYLIIFILLIIMIFCLFLFLLMEIILGESQTKIYKKCVTFTNLLINPLIIFLYIPIMELILLPLKCEDGVIDIVKDGIKCYADLHYLYMAIGIIGSFLFFICCFFVLNFYFYPFQYSITTLRKSSFNDIFLLIAKFIFIFRYIYVKNHYISILILLLLSLFILTCEFNDPTYEDYTLMLMCNIRNISVFWTYFVLLMSKIFENYDINGMVYLLLFGYPIINFCFIIFINKNELEKEKINDRFDNVNNYLSKTNYKIKLIESFLDSNKSSLNNNNMEYQGNEIILKGLIQKHNESCINEDCHLKKFSTNPGNYFVQKQCLLNYMNYYFEKGIKKFPQSVYLLIYYIQFNYSKRYNLNSVRVNLSKLKNMDKTIHEEFIIFCIEQNVKKIKNKTNDNSDNNEQELEKDLMKQKYQRLKYLIENSTKLYGEFWGIFATNITNNLNTLKLFTLGGKLNQYLNEINSIWENDIKPKKIDISFQGIIQLYSHFLKDILWNKKKSDEVYKKLNEENHHHETKKIDEVNFHGNNYEAILENPDYTFFCSSNDKAKCTIVQCSNSLINLLGYQKSELIGKSLEILMPHIMIEGHMKTLEEYIKNLNTVQKSSQEFNRNIENKQIFMLPKNKMGYIMPFICKFTIYDDNDFSNSYIIKGKLEPKESKTFYVYYILTKNDYTANYISSSALHLGLTMDLLKKYMVKIDLLIRAGDDRKLKFDDILDELEEKEREITWVFPDLLYPKDELKRKENEHTDLLIKNSKKQNFFLKINVFRNSNNDIIGICFRMIDKNRYTVKNLNLGEYMPKEGKEFLFDIITLTYVRTIIVDKKTGLRNLRDKDNESKEGMNSKRMRNSQANNKRESKMNNYNKKNNATKEDDDDEDRKKEYILTREKINELQGENCSYIKNIINNLPFYGRDVQLEKHRPNKEIYPVGRVQEPNIKILISNFSVSLLKVNRYKSSNNNVNLNEGNLNYNMPSKKLTDDLNKEFTSDTSTSLSNIFNAKSIFYIKLLSLFIIVLIIGFIILEFVFTFIHLNDIKARIEYLEYGYQLLSNMVYTKYFISEAVFANEIPEKFPDKQDIDYYYNDIKRKKYIKELQTEMGEYLVLFNRLLNNFNSANITLSKKYTSFTGKVNMSVYTITISDGNKNESVVFETFSAAMRRIPSDVFYISSNSQENYVINMQDQNCYELMRNILNTFYITWKNATIILLEDVKSHCLKSTLSYVLLVSSFFVTFICLFLIYKLLIIFFNDRAKPINLFLTIKKNIFEELKNISEGFSNKLLNKFFGNEENEEETQQDYQANIKDSDINIIKFKAPNEHKSTGNKDKTNYIIFMQLTFFLVFCNAYIVFKFCYTYDNIQNISKFLNVFNTTHTTHTNIILSIDVIKSFLFNDSIPIFSKNGKNETLNSFLDVFYNGTNAFEETILATSKSNSFLDDNYKNKFYEYLYHDYSELVKDENETILIKIKKQNNFKPILNRLFEDLKYISLKYLNNGYKEKREEEEKSNPDVNNGYPSEIISDKIWVDINELTTIYIRYWFKNILHLMMISLNDYVSQMRLIHITIFIVLVILIIFAYCIVWKNYEKKLKSMLNRSFNLINLIPEEIKYMIVAKINE